MKIRGLLWDVEEFETILADYAQRQRADKAEVKAQKKTEASALERFHAKYAYFDKEVTPMK